MTLIDTRINGRWTLKLPPHRAELAEWASGWERERLDSEYDHIGPGDLVYDIGAEEGDLSALYALWGADVVLFEPDCRVWPNVRAIFEGNHLASRVRGTFVGFAAAESSFAPVPPEQAPWPACADGPLISDHGFLNIDERPDVDRIALDQYVQGTGRIPTVITVDVEGAELEVMKGAERTLREHRPLVFCSVHPEFMFQHHGQYENDLHSFMGGVNYAPTHLAYDHEHHYLWEPC